MALFTPKLESEPNPFINLSAGEELMAGRKEVARKVEELNKQYPYALLSPSVVEYKGNGIYSVSGDEMTEEGLKKHVISMHNSYAPSDKDDPQNK